MAAVAFTIRQPIYFLLKQVTLITCQVLSIFLKCKQTFMGVYQYPISPFADHHPGCFTDPNQRPYFEQHYSYHYPYGAPHPPVAVDDNFNFDNSAYNNYPPESHEAYHQRPPFPNQFPAGLPTDSLPPPPKSASPKRAKPAAHNSSDTNACRRRTSQHDFYCSKCEVHIGIVFIRGAYSSLCAQPVDLLCTTCSNYVPSEQNDDLAEQKKRKRTDSNSVSTANDKIDCEVCHSVLGHGGLTDHVSEGEIKTEFICTDCGDKYMFCSECGGGGKQRTGKWRPKELFEAGRRTCSLPHIRVGAAEVHYKVIPLNELNSYVLQGIQDVFFDCLLSLYCVPSVMTTDKYRTFEQIKAEIVKLWSESVLDVLTNNVLTGQKYVTVAWIQKRHRNKGTAKPNTSKDAAPWLQKFGLTNVVIPQPKSRNSQEDDQCFVAFSIAEWDIHSQSIFLAQMAPRSVFLKTMEGYIDLIKNCVSQIKSDATALQVAKPAHIWCWAHSDHARLQSIPSRLKFVSTEEYLALHPNVSPEAFERFDYEPLKNEGTTLHASSVKPFSK